MGIWEIFTNKSVKFYCFKILKCNIILNDLTTEYREKMYIPSVVPTAQSLFVFENLTLVIIDFGDFSITTVKLGFTK